MHPLRLSEPRAALVTRIALSYYVTSGLSAAVGLFVISGCMQLWLGTFAAAAASIGVIVVVPPDQPAPRRGKFWQMCPSVCVGVPLFYAVRTLQAEPLQLGLLLVPATFIAFLGAAWGRRGIPLSISAMFAMIFSMAAGSRAGADAVVTTGYFAMGAVGYLLFATLANSLLNARYRGQMLADTLLSMASLLRSQAGQFTARTAADGAASPIVRLLGDQAALADQLQSARDILLESPRTPRRQQLAGMLMRLLEMRDHVLACELDLDLLIVYPHQDPVLAVLREILNDHAGHLERLADSLLLGRRPEPAKSQRALLANLPWSGAPAPDALARGLASRIGNISDEIGQLYALARGEAEPELAVVRASWQMFISPTAWSWQPFKGVWRWDAPPLRHAIRAALAIGTAYAISLVVPWGTHAYWILLTIVVVLRGSLAQTIERRNSRVAGTLVGSALAGLLLACHAPVVVLMVFVTLAQGIAHAFAVRRYLVTAIAATVLALLQAHLLNAGTSAAFEAFERIADTLLGVGIAWGFSYVLPAWERKQIPALIARTLEAQARHAQASLELGQLTAVDDRPELQWRLARREVYDSLSALVQATQRCLSEPRAVRPPLEPLGHLLAHSYQLLAQLTAAKTMLLVRRGHLNPELLAAPLQNAVEKIESILKREAPLASHAVAQRVSSSEPLALPDPFGQEVTPWLLRRLHVAIELAEILVDDARRIEEPLASATSIRQDGC
ncbi:MAG: hypothetical protein QOD56_1040 [Gammaproteobacteria bacterium]|nr:hypothetical protein [Gammaproteobacteria bacterium]